MTPAIVSLGILSFLHDLFTALWVGGLLTLALTVMPVLRKAMDKEQAKPLMNAIQAKLSRFVYISIVGLAVTGILLSKRNDGFTRLFMFGTPFQAMLSVKHALMFVMVALAVVRSAVLPRLKMAPQKKNALSAVFLLTNAAAGVLMLALSGFTSALA